MSEDRSFYDLWAEEDKPEDDQRLVIEAAKLKAKKYSLDNRIYIVRGYEIFCVHSSDIQMKKMPDGTRQITANNSRMIKYTEDGKRLTE